MRLQNETLQHGSPAQFASLAVQADELPMYQSDVNVSILTIARIVRTLLLVVFRLL